MINDIENIRIERIVKIIELCKTEQKYWEDRAEEFKLKLEVLKYL